MGKIYITAFLGIFLSMAFVDRSTSGEQKPTIKINYVINLEKSSLPEEKRPDFTEEKANMPKLEYDKIFKQAGTKHFLKKDADSFFEEKRRLNKAREALDIRRISKELQEELIRGFTLEGFSISQENPEYVLEFVVNEIAYDDFKGGCYIRSLDYKLLRGSETIYVGSFIPKKKKLWLSGGEFVKLIKTSKIAKRMLQDLYDVLQSEEDSEISKIPGGAQN